MVWLLGQWVQHARQQQGFLRPLASWRGVGGMPVAEKGYGLRFTSTNTG